MVTHLVNFEDYESANDSLSRLCLRGYRVSTQAVFPAFLYVLVSYRSLIR